MKEIKEILNTYLIRGYEGIPHRVLVDEDFDNLVESIFYYCDNNVLKSITKLAYDKRMEVTIQFKD